MGMMSITRTHRYTYIDTQKSHPGTQQRDNGKWAVRIQKHIFYLRHSLGLIAPYTIC